MGKTTAIEWTDATVNFWHGCKKVSPGCKFCYMYRDKARYGQDPMKVVRSAPATFNAALKWDDPKRIFTCSWSDFFIEEADEWREAAWDIIRRTPQHSWQILTKRPERILEHLPADWGKGWGNVWLGTSVENQKYADERIPELLKVPAAVRFLSVEPLLGPVDLNLCQKDIIDGCLSYRWDGLDWVIVGGESGPGARPMHPDWVRAIRDEVEPSFSTGFFFKQWGEWYPLASADEADNYPNAKMIEQDGMRWVRLGKKESGRLLDGRIWDEMPGPPVIAAR